MWRRGRRRGCGTALADPFGNLGLGLAHLAFELCVRLSPLGFRDGRDQRLHALGQLAPLCRAAGEYGRGSRFRGDGGGDVLHPGGDTLAERHRRALDGGLWTRGRRRLRCRRGGGRRLRGERRGGHKQSGGKAEFQGHDLCLQEGMPPLQISPPVQAAFRALGRRKVAHAADAPYLSDGTQQGTAMTTFDDRERAFETKYARDEEMRFRVIARRNKLLGAWAARLMGLTPAEAEGYARDVIHADFEEAGDEVVIRKLLGDLISAGVDIDEARIREALDHRMVEARRQLMQAEG
jgi:hypothetical protein